MIGRPSRVLVRALWQTVNIGDVAHAPGTLRAFQRWWADAELILWPRAADERTRSMLRRFLPEVRVVEGVVDGDGRASTPELADALDAADLFVHGSGPSLNAEREVRSWRRRTGRPYGFFGVTVDPMWSSSRRPGTGTLDRLADRAAGLPAGDLADDTRELLDGAAFVFCRDAISLDYVRAQHVAAPVVEFGPDATFAFDLHDRPVAEGILRAAGLHRRDPGFLCVVPRLRYTPYHLIRGLEPTDEHRRRDTVNAEHRDHDLGLLRDVIAACVTETGMDVLVCPEMTYQVELGRDLVDRLPGAVASQVTALSRFWGPHEAAAVYARAHGVLSQECHSPILAIAAGTPSVYVRQPTDTVKGQMYAQLGLGDDVFEIDQISSGDLTSAVLARHADRAAALERTDGARRLAEDHLAAMVAAAAASGWEHVEPPSR